MNSDPTIIHLILTHRRRHFSQTLQERQLQKSRLSQCMIRCLVRHRCMIRHLSPNAIRHLRRLSRSIPRCMTRCLIPHRCAILRHRLNSHGLRLLNMTRC